MPEKNERPLSPLERIALNRAHRPKVDHNGRPIGPAMTYVYDRSGELIEVRPADE